MELSNGTDSPNETVPECQMSEAMVAAKDTFFFVAYYVLTPMFLFLGVFGQCMCLLTFYKQSKTLSYNYQIMVAFSELLEIIFYFLYVMNLNILSGFVVPGPYWFKRNFTLMFFSGYVVGPIINGLITSTMLFSVCMVLDRSVALTKPFFYKDLNHYKVRVWAFLLCVFLTVGTTAFDGFRYVVVPQDDIYIITSSAIKTSQFMNAFSGLRNGMYVLGLVILIVCDVLMISVFREKATRSKQLKGGVDMGMKPEEKTLLMFTICQSTLITVGMSSLTFFYAMVYGVPVFISCEGQIVLPIVDVLCQLSASADFYLLILFSKRFRQMVRSSICGRNTIFAANSSGMRSVQDNIAGGGFSLVNLGRS